MAPQFTEMKGLPRAIAVEVDGAGHQLLAGPALAGDHRGGGAVRDLADGLEDLAHPGALADDVVEAVLRLELLPEVEVLVAEALALERPSDDEVDLVELERLGDVVVGPELHGLDRGLGGADGGDHDHHRLGGGLLRRAQDLEAVGGGHPEVGDDHVEGLTPQGVDGGLAAVRHRHLEVLLLQGDGEKIAHALLVVHHQHTRHHSWGLSPPLD